MSSIAKEALKRAGWAGWVFPVMAVEWTLLPAVARLPGKIPDLKRCAPIGRRLSASERRFLHHRIAGRFPLPGVANHRPFHLCRKWNILLNFSVWSNRQAFIYR